MSAKTLLLGRYRVLRALARGGMGVVYLARTEGAKGFSRPVVIKRVLPGSSSDSEKMFVREARILSALSHPGIVAVIDFERVDDSYIMVLEYVHGRHLGLWAKCLNELERRIDPVIAIQIVISVLDALHHAHTLKRADGGSLNIIHRDISPSNILIDTDGHVKLVDFGVARMLGDESSYVTKDLAFKGKLSYTAPEIFQESAPSRVTDVYACAVVLHELLTGRNELRGEDDAKTLVAVLRQVPTPPSQLRDDVSPELDAVLAKALAKQPDERYQTAAELAAALRAVRPISEDEAIRRVAEGVAEIFPEIERIMRVTSLADLEEAWQRPPEDSPDERELLKRLSEPDLLVVEPEAETRSTATTIPAPMRRREEEERDRPSRWPLFLALALATVAAVASGVAIWQGSQGNDGGTSSVILVQRGNGNGPEEDPDAGPAEVIPDPPLEADAGPASSEPPEDDVDAGRRRVVRPPTPQNRGTTIGRRFARRQRVIQQCFEEHVSDVSGAPRVVVVLVVGPDGRVVEASLEPAAVGSTPLGACLIQVARGTTFDPQPGIVQVRIPIAARTR